MPADPVRTPPATGTPLLARGLGWLLRVLGLLPLPWAHALGGGIGQLLWWQRGRSRHTAEVNLRLCYPELEPATRERLARAALRETGRALLELGAIWTWPGARIADCFVDTEGAELLAEGARRGKGVLFAAPHLGCWEMTSHYALLHGHRLTALYRPPRQPALESLVRGCRERLGATLVPTDTGGIRALLQALRRGECVGILPDQDPGRDGVFAPFFGVPTATLTLFAGLARRSDATLLLAFAERLPAGRFRLHLRPLPEAVRDRDPLIAATALNAAIEAAVREFPTQYQWTYRRFKALPPGARSRYR